MEDTDELKRFPGNVFVEYSSAEIRGWEEKWTGYLLNEYEWQLAPYSRYPDTPPLPDNPADLIGLSLGWGPLLSLYCDKEAILGKSLMELGCGCGNLGKCLARYCSSFLGVDCSRIALGIARLVSPANCTYLHVNQHRELLRYCASVDTVVSRFFWIHQNIETSKRALRFLSYFLKPKGKIYMDFFMGAPDQADPGWDRKVQALPPWIAGGYGSLYEYTFEDISSLVEECGFHVVHHTPHGRTQRRYVVVERMQSENSRSGKQAV